MCFQTETKESKWEMPDDVIVYLDQVQEELKTSTPGQPAAGYLCFSYSIFISLMMYALVNLELLPLQDSHQSEEQLKVHSSPWEALTFPHLLPHPSPNNPTALVMLEHLPLRSVPTQVTTVYRSLRILFCQRGLTCRMTPSFHTTGLLRWRRARRHLFIC